MPYERFPALRQAFLVTAQNRGIDFVGGWRSLFCFSACNFQAVGAAFRVVFAGCAIENASDTYSASP
jgi:hypothetical protein